MATQELVAFCCTVQLLAQFCSDQFNSGSWEISLRRIQNMAKAILSANLRSGSVEGSRLVECSTAAASICSKDAQNSREHRSHPYALLM